MFAVVDSFAAREAFDGRRCVRPGEYDLGEHALVVELGGVGGDAEVVAAESDAEVDLAQVVVHLVEVPERFDVGADLVVQHGCRHGWCPQSGIGKE